jgi:hypothetical protein
VCCYYYAVAAGFVVNSAAGYYCCRYYSDVAAGFVVNSAAGYYCCRYYSDVAAGFVEGYAPAAAGFVEGYAAAAAAFVVGFAADDYLSDYLRDDYSTADYLTNYVAVAACDCVAENHLPDYLAGAENHLPDHRAVAENHLPDYLAVAENHMPDYNYLILPVPENQPGPPGHNVTHMAYLPAAENQVPENYQGPEKTNNQAPEQTTEYY